MSLHAIGHTRTALVIVHLFAGGLALYGAWLISATPFVTSAAQFVAPLAIVLLVHLAWLAICHDLRPGFSRVALGRTLASVIAVMICTALGAVFLPMPVEAQDHITNVPLWLLSIVSCLLIVTVVLAVVALFVYALASAAIYIYNLLRRSPKGPGESKLFDFGIAALALIVIASASLEGVRPGLMFAACDRASVTKLGQSSPERVWREVGRATSPRFPLPAIFDAIPKPVAVLVDEGAGLGARRVVRFAGREGAGELVLQVVRRTDTVAVFEAVSDTSPVARWVRHKSLTFRVEPDVAATRLTVSWEYDRLLSPAWFFRPFIHLACRLAVDVLARDTKQRAEM